MTNLKQLERAIKKQQKLVAALDKDKRDYTSETFGQSSFEYLMANTILDHLKYSLNFVTKVQTELDSLK